MVVGDMLEPDNSSSNQFWRKILEGMVMVLLDSRYEVMGIMKCRNGVLRWARARQSYQQLREDKKTRSASGITVDKTTWKCVRE
jgi:hypothetical protein